LIPEKVIETVAEAFWYSDSRLY